MDVGWFTRGRNTSMSLSLSLHRKTLLELQLWSPVPSAGRMQVGTPSCTQWDRLKRLHYPCLPKWAVQLSLAHEPCRPGCQNTAQLHSTGAPPAQPRAGPPSPVFRLSKGEAAISPKRRSPSLAVSSFTALVGIAVSEWLRSSHSALIRQVSCHPDPANKHKRDPSHSALIDLKTKQRQLKPSDPARSAGSKRPCS